jgi:hypothetical protein
MRNLINAIGFQTAWWALVAGVAYGFEVPALIYSVVLASAHLFYAPHARQDLRLAGLALVMGIAIDSVLQYAGVMHFQGLAILGLSPFWLWMLWVLFALTLNASMAFFKTKPLALSALAGLVFGPLSYYAGGELGAASWDGPKFPWLVLGMAWMFAMPVLVFLSKKLVTPMRGFP